MDLFLHIISRSKAKELGMKRYFTAQECKNGHVTERLLSNGVCIKCGIDRKRNNYDKNKESIAKSKRRYYESKKESLMEYSRNYYGKNAEAISERKRKKREENRESILECERKYREENRETIIQRNRKWRAENPEYWQQYAIENTAKINAKAAKRRAAKLQRTLPGHEEEILAIYEKASERRANGEDVEVDHIIPLQGRLISGLHVPLNLAIVTMSENRAKYNSFEPYSEAHAEH